MFFAPCVGKLTNGPLPVAIFHWPRANQLLMGGSPFLRSLCSFLDFKTRYNFLHTRRQGINLFCGRTGFTRIFKCCISF